MLTAGIALTERRVCSTGSLTANKNTPQNFPSKIHGFADGGDTSSRLTALITGQLGLLRSPKLTTTEVPGAQI